MALQVVGAGLGRTGTASLKVALEQLGIGRCYHMGEVMQNQHHIPLWIDAADGRPDWDSLFEGYTAAVDYPACSFWRELMDYYPDSKVLLSTRDPDSWFNSVHETILSPDFTEFLEHAPHAEFFEKAVWKDYKAHINEREFMVNYYRQREDMIRNSVAPERLLVYRIGDGWEPLCDFLEVPVPATEYPRVNSRQETRAMLDAMIAGAGDLAERMKQEVGRLFKSSQD